MLDVRPASRQGSGTTRFYRPCDWSPSAEQENVRGNRAFWRALHAARADIVLAGHDHVYERFARQSATGSASSTGPVQFMVGTGGKSLEKSYQWRFARAGNNAGVDGGSAPCV